MDPRTVGAGTQDWIEATKGMTIVAYIGSYVGTSEVAGAMPFPVKDFAILSERTIGRDSWPCVVADFDSDPIPDYAKRHHMPESEAATEIVVSSPDLVEQIEESVASLRKGEQLLTHEEVFGL